MIGEHPPKWLAWANTSVARAVTTAIAIVGLVAAAVIGAQWQTYTTCVADQQALADERTRAIAVATDAERQADMRKLAGPQEGPEAERLRAEAIAARAVTDRVRASNPPPPARDC